MNTILVYTPELWNEDEGTWDPIGTSHTEFDDAVQALKNEILEGRDWADWVGDWEETHYGYLREYDDGETVMTAKIVETKMSI